MVEYTPYGEIPIPTEFEADQVPADLKRAFYQVDPQLVLRARSELDRNTKYADVPRGTIVTGTEVEAVWRKRDTGSNSWDRLWSDSGWNEVNLLNSFQIVSDASRPRWRRVGELVVWRGLIKLPSGYNGAGPSTPESDGWVAWCNVPGDALPSMNNETWPSFGGAGEEADAGIRYLDGQMHLYSQANGSRSLWFSTSFTYFMA